MLVNDSASMCLRAISVASVHSLSMHSVTTVLRQTFAVPSLTSSYLHSLSDNTLLIFVFMVQRERVQVGFIEVKNRECG